MNKLQRRAAIELATGKKVDEVALDEGCHRTTFYRALNGELNKSPLYDRISEIAGFAKHELWPDKFKDSSN